MFKPSTFDISQFITFDELKSDFNLCSHDIVNQQIDLLTVAKHIEKDWVV